MWPFDQNNQYTYQQYAQAYDTGNYDGFDHNQTLGYLQQFMQGAPLDLQQQLYQQHFSQMPYEQRAFLAQQVPPQYAMDPNDPWSMSQSFLRLGQEQPHLLQQIFRHPLLIGAAAGLAGLVAKHLLEHHQRYQGQYGNQQYGYNQGNQYGNPQYGYNQGYQQPYAQQELAQDQAEIQELRRELRNEERREERLEERERHHHRREQDYF
jgi:hypothetical protein